MGGLAKVFSDFKTRYLSSSKISGNAPAFLAELNQIVKAVNERIGKEEAELYPLLSRI